MSHSYQRALSIKQQTVDWRRQFHRHPELSFAENRTSAFITDRLREFGLEVETDVGKTGVVGLLRGEPDWPCIMLRFDMDALPLSEQNQVDYCSQEQGRMHACGHDAHMAIGLSVAKLLSESPEKPRSTIKFVFQPAEEIGLGAKAMIADGVLENPQPDFALGVHVWNERPIGWVGASSGAVMAGSDVFSLRITGKGGHGAAPHQSTDPIVAAAQVINGLQTIVSRNVDPLDQAVVSLGSIHGGEAKNIIPEEVQIGGTLRFYNETTQQLLHRRINEIVNGTLAAMNCKGDFVLNQSTKPVINDSALTLRAIKAFQSLSLGLTIDTNYRTLISEDMAYFLNMVPGVFLFVGCGSLDQDKRFPHHHGCFNIDEECMTIAVAFLLEMVEELDHGTV